MPKDELIAALEKATGPDRELDCEIALAVDGGEIVWKMANYTMESHPARRYASSDHVGGYGNAPVPQYTASIDAALTLVPEGWTRDVDATAPEMGIAVTLYEPKGGPDGKRAIGDHASEAIAICLAALRATERGEAGR